MASLSPFFRAGNPGRATVTEDVWAAFARRAGRESARGDFRATTTPVLHGGTPGGWPSGGVFSESSAAADFHTGRTPALRPDVALLHAQRADEFGNVQVWGHQGDARWAYWAAKKVIVSSFVIRA